MHRKIINKNDIEKFQKNLDTLRDWVVENGMKINPVKCKAIGFTRIRVQNPLGYTLGNQKIRESRSNNTRDQSYEANYPGWTK